MDLMLDFSDSNIYQRYASSLQKTMITSGHTLHKLKTRHNHVNDDVGMNFLHSSLECHMSAKQWQQNTWKEKKLIRGK